MSLNRRLNRVGHLLATRLIERYSAGVIKGEADPSNSWRTINCLTDYQVIQFGCGLISLTAAKQLSIPANGAAPELRLTG